MWHSQSHVKWTIWQSSHWSPLSENFQELTVLFWPPKTSNGLPLLGNSLYNSLTMMIFKLSCKEIVQPLEANNDNWYTIKQEN